jgi:hypothetical protein
VILPQELRHGNFAVPVPNVELANVGVSRAHRFYRAERESGIPRPTLAPHDDCNGRDGYRHMKKRYGNRQTMMAVFMTFAVPQLFVGSMFERLAFGEKLLFVLAVPLCLFFEVVGFRTTAAIAKGVVGLKLLQERNSYLRCRAPLALLALRVPRWL